MAAPALSPLITTPTSRLCPFSFQFRNPSHLRARNVGSEGDKFRRLGGRTRRRGGGRAVIASTGDIIGGDFGARDPFPAELESNFGDKVLGNAGTEHRILIPNASILSLAERSCKPLPPGVAPLTVDEAKGLLRKVVGWRLVEGEAGLKLQCEWKLKDHAAGLELLNRVSAVAEAEGHLPELHLDEQTNMVRAEIWTHSMSGLTENDFILAAKIDKVKTSDLIKKNKFWA